MGGGGSNSRREWRSNIKVEGEANRRREEIVYSKGEGVRQTAKGKGDQTLQE